MKSWIQITEHQAINHPLYGVGGWLKFFYILFVLIILRALGHSAGLVYEKTGAVGLSVLLPSKDVAIFGMQLIDWFQIIIYTTIIYFGVTKKESFRRTSNLLLVGFIVIKPLIFLLTGNYLMGMVTLPSHLIFIVTLMLYLNLSKRVRVTYEWAVKSNDTVLTADSNTLDNVTNRSSFDNRKEPYF